MDGAGAQLKARMAKQKKINAQAQDIIDDLRCKSVVIDPGIRTRERR
jgi:hypothetical protein